MVRCSCTGQSRSKDGGAAPGGRALAVFLDGAPDPNEDEDEDDIAAREKLVDDYNRAITGSSCARLGVALFPNVEVEYGERAPVLRKLAATFEKARLANVEVYSPNGLPEGSSNYALAAHTLTLAATKRVITITSSIPKAKPKRVCLDREFASASRRVLTISPRTGRWQAHKL